MAESRTPPQLSQTATAALMQCRDPAAPISAHHIAKLVKANPKLMPVNEISSTHALIHSGPHFGIKLLLWTSMPCNTQPAVCETHSFCEAAF
jgi:hypothetical protein